LATTLHTMVQFSLDQKSKLRARHSVGCNITRELNRYVVALFSTCNVEQIADIIWLFLCRRDHPIIVGIRARILLNVKNGIPKVATGGTLVSKHVACHKTLQSGIMRILEVVGSVSDSGIWIQISILERVVAGVEKAPNGLVPFGFVSSSYVFCILIVLFLES